ncbi:MAG: nonstructural protein [Microvirus sp.]|nr:MAG: nonstructural protein [Microvirus sp.]
MEYQIFAIRDSAVEAFMVPMFFPSKGAAIRAFGDEVQRNATDNNLNKHPQDFAMYEIGKYNDQDGVFETKLPTIVSLATDHIDPK